MKRHKGVRIGRSLGLLSPAGRIASGALLTGVACSVHASGFALLEQSASGLGTAFAGTTVAAEDATTIFYNPAGLAKLHHAQLLVVASGVKVNSEFQNGNSQSALVQSLGNDGDDAGGWNSVPSVYLALPINKDLAFGLGIGAPFGLKLEYDDGWIGRFQALKSEIKTYNINPALSIRLGEQFTLGLGLNYQRLQAELTNAVNYTAVVARGLQQLVAAGQLPAAAVPALLAANAGLEGHARVRGDDASWGFNIGLLFEPAANTRIGLAYRSAVDYTVEGSARFIAPSVADPVGAAIIGAAGAPGGALATGPVSVDIELPDMATASLLQRVGGNVEILADVSWTGWSTLKELRVVRDSGAVLSVTPERWKDTWRYALGATYRLTDQWKLRGGVAYDEAPVPEDTRTPRLPDESRKWIAFGARWQQGESLVIDAGYAHLFIDDAALNQNDGSTATNAMLNGEEQSSIDVLSVQLAYRF